jgi:hypothetical protein
MITTFNSNDHIRYENGVEVGGHNKGCKREIKIEQNKTYPDAFTVSILNHDVYPSNYSMGGKRMKIISKMNNMIEFRGFGEDPMGFSFANYGVTLKLKNDKVVEAVLNMFDRNISISYLYDSSLEKEDSELQIATENGILAVKSNDATEILFYSKVVTALIKNDMEFLDTINEDNKTDLRKISTLLYEASRRIEKNPDIEYLDLLLMALLVNIIDYKLSPGLENLVAERIVITNGHPGVFVIFIERHVIPYMGNDKLIGSHTLEDLSIKLQMIIVAEIVNTTFIKKNQSFKGLYDFYIQEIEKGFFSPLTSHGDINRAKTKLLELLLINLIRFFKTKSNF